MLKLGIIGSGKGSNYRSIQDAIDTGKLDAETRIVIADVETAGILDIARSRGIPALYVPPGKFRTKLDSDAEARVVTALRDAGVELVVLAGFMRMIKEPLLAAFPHRIINIHPALLPEFRGLEAWKQALAAGATKTGCTVHHVDAGMDTGEIIAQSEVPVLPGDTPETLHARIQVAEHGLYPRVIAQFAAKLSQ
jgi:phosphoribosylglycinamide formyltransferase-1